MQQQNHLVELERKHQALDLQLVSRDHALEGLDGRVEVPVFLLQSGEFELELGRIVVGGFQGASPSKARAVRPQTMRFGSQAGQG